MKFFTFLFLLFGLIQASAQNFQLKNYTVKNGIPNAKIVSITQDNIGAIWLASKNKISKFNGEEFNNYDVKNSVINILEVKNDSLLIGTNNSFTIYAHGKFSHFESKKVHSILTVEGIIFVGTAQGIYRLREDYLSPLKTNFQIDLNQINDLKFDGKYYFIATNKALWKVDNLLKPTSLKRVEIGDFKTISIFENQIITSNEIGLFFIEGEQAFLIAQQPKEITDIQKINNQFWIATKNNGITVLNTDFTFDKNINKYNTLATNNINLIFKDQQNNVWIATENAGLYKYETDSKKTLKPIITLTNIDVVYEPLDSININQYKKVLQLPSDKNHVSFSYKTVNINNPKAVAYRFKLNEKFSPWTNKESIDFANLSAGNYTFIAQSKIDTVESEPISFRFFIDKPLYKKDWFLWSLLGGLSLLLGLIILNYINRMKKRNKAKVEKLKLENHLLSLEQKALQLQMNPHFIFNVLNGIKALGSTGKTKELSSTISKFATLLRSVLLNSRQEEISLSEEIATLKNYLELEQQMSANLFDFNIKTNLSIDEEEILIPPMLLQPFIENSIKHGINLKEDGEITVLFTTNNNFLQCTIDDNGIGFEQSKKQSTVKNHQSVAVKVTQERIENLSKQSTFSIKELKEKENTIGTRVWFKIPLKTDY
ncbi:MULTISPECIES: sensor histidine kinase [Tenacibaculum]|uniref:sensor histidine kinase n=1 Tax=Tenacibaculum TaxID=104267 RepID=UPI001F0A523A|nr:MULTISPECIES: histidine kinase [Tenacibaculum]